MLAFGIKGKQSVLVQAIEKDGTLVGSAIVFAIVMIAFAAWGLLLLKRSHEKRWVAIVYSIMLFLSAIIFIGIAIAAPIVKSKRLVAID